MKNLRQMGSTFLINRFRHKLKIPESSQNDPNEENNKDSYP